MIGVMLRKKLLLNDKKFMRLGVKKYSKPKQSCLILTIWWHQVT